MVTVNNKTGDGGSATFEFVGLSGDTKPSGKWGGTAMQRGEATEIIGAQDIAENSLFLELDTGKLYYYYEGEWCELGTTSGGGGGGGGTGSNELLITGELDVETMSVDNVDTELSEVLTAAAENRPIRFCIYDSTMDVRVDMRFCQCWDAGAIFSGVVGIGSGSLTYYTIIVVWNSTVMYCELSEMQIVGG